MPQLSLYLDEPTMSLLRLDAAAQKLSLSKYTAQLIARNHTSVWPNNYFGLYGSIDDESFSAPEEQEWENSACSFDDFALR